MIFLREILLIALIRIKLFSHYGKRNIHFDIWQMGYYMFEL